MATFLCPHCRRPSITADNVPGLLVRCPSCHEELLPSGLHQQTVTLSPGESKPQTGPSESETLPPVAAGEAAGHAPAPALAAELPGKVDIPGYAIERELGRGGMGVVYQALDLRLKRRVALKMVLSGGHAGEVELARFRTEAEAVARLQHANIVQIHEVGTHEGLPFFSLEFCPGGSLDRKLDGTPLPPQEAAALVEQLAQAMHAAHQKGVIHRDLKPANVLLAEDGTPKITDFGLAKKLDEVGQTSTGSIMGTPSYMAPEQAGGRSKEIGPAADVYALGAILYECLTGRPPFKAATALDTILQVVSEEPVPVRQIQPRVPCDLETICLKCLHKSLARRYASAGLLAEDLQRFQRQEPITARPVGVTERLGRWCRRHPGWAALIAMSLLALLAMLAGGIWFTRQLDLELTRTEQARQATLAAEQNLRQALTRQVAEQLDSDLRQLAAIPRTVSAALGGGCRPGDWSAEQLQAWLRRLLADEPRLFALCLAFEPRQFSPQQQDYALYVQRNANGIQSKLLLPPAYVPLYREWDWYRIPRDEKGASWSEPYVDRGGGDIPMITYSVPIERQGRFAGVVTADLSIEYLQTLRDRLAELRLGEGSYGFVVSRKGAFISHPDPRYGITGRSPTLSALPPDDSFRPLARRILNGERGTGRALDFAGERPAAFLFAPVSSSGWSFVTVVPEAE